MLAAELEVSTRAVPHGTEATITARTFARDVTLLVDKVSPDAHAEEGLVTLLPGESATVIIRHQGDALDAQSLADPRVLRTANELVAR